MRTIFVALLSNIVIGNFDMPGGLLDQLIKRKDKNTRIVFLTLTGFEKRIKPFVNGDTAVLEVIPKSKPPHGFQKLFQFFYSYLIFTGTTKILATYGARADVPPAGGNRYAAPIKWLLANTFGKSRFVKCILVNFLFPYFFPERRYQNLFDRYEPSAVFLPNIAFLPDLEILLEARRRKIITVGMACNWDHLNKYFIPLRADYLLVQNEPMMNEAVNLQEYEPDRVQPVGFAQFDAYINYPKYAISKREFFKVFSIPEGSRVILFVSGSKIKV